MSRDLVEIRLKRITQGAQEAGRLISLMDSPRLFLFVEGDYKISVDRGNTLTLVIERLNKREFRIEFRRGGSVWGSWSSGEGRLHFPLTLLLRENVETLTLSAVVEETEEILVSVG